MTTISNINALKSTLVEKLVTLYEDACLLSIKHECIIIAGGSALVLSDSIERSTEDIDLLSTVTELEALIETYNMNSRMQHYESNFPYHYKDRLRRIQINTTCLKFYIPSLEDLIVSKLYALRPKDKEDLIHIMSDKKYNLELLDKLVQEAKLSAINEHVYREMVQMYKRYFKEDE